MVDPDTEAERGTDDVQKQGVRYDIRIEHQRDADPQRDRMVALAAVAERDLPDHAEDQHAEQVRRARPGEPGE
jgi:hypothetical protein